MPFDPKLIQPDDAPLDDVGEIDLPDDLAELAAQLRDDALFLAERYPAEPATRIAAQPLLAAPVMSARGRNTRWFYVGSGVAAALAVVLMFALYPPAPAARQLVDREITEARPASPPEVMSVVALPVVAPPGAEEPAPALGAPPPALPSSFLNGVSGPELEGLMDLWENDGQGELRIEI